MNRSAATLYRHRFLSGIVSHLVWLHFRIEFMGRRFAQWRELVRLQPAIEQQNSLHERPSHPGAVFPV
jgi:hypothetical protein